MSGAQMSFLASIPNPQIYRSVSGQPPYMVDCQLPHLFKVSWMLSPTPEDATAVIVNFKTPLLVKDAVESFVEFYPDTPIVIIDNGGCSDSLAIIHSIAIARSNITLVENPENIGHGLGLHQGVVLATTPYVFTLDSDTRIEKPGFLELMLDEFASDEKLFAIGWLRRVNRNGVAFRTQDTGLGDPYIHPYASLIDVDKYKSMEKGFVHSGAPAIHLMQEAVSRGYSLASFPIEDYIWHKEAGTRGMFGGKIKVDTDVPTGVWSKRRL